MAVAPHYEMFTLLPLLTLFTLLKQKHVCQYVLLGKVRMLLEWEGKNAFRMG